MSIACKTSCEFSTCNTRKGNALWLNCLAQQYSEDNIRCFLQDALARHLQSESKMGSFHGSSGARCWDSLNWLFSYTQKRHAANHIWSINLRSTKMNQTAISSRGAVKLAIFSPGNLIKNARNTLESLRICLPTYLPPYLLT